MTRLLVSVRSEEEARRALEGGADLIDVKEPHRGSLGSASPEVWRDVVRAVAGRAPVSIALGELMHDAADLSSVDFPAIDFVKIGLAACGGCPTWQTRWRAAMHMVPQGVQRVAVAYADWSAADAPPPKEVLKLGCEMGCRAFLLDTLVKRSGTVFSVMDVRELERLLESARREHVMTVLAGSLDLQNISHACSLCPDVIAVRGAACDGQRTATIDLERVRELRDILDKQPLRNSTMCHL